MNVEFRICSGEILSRIGDGTVCGGDERGGGRDNERDEGADRAGNIETAHSAGVQDQNQEGDSSKPT